MLDSNQKRKVNDIIHKVECKEWGIDLEQARQVMQTIGRGDKGLSCNVLKATFPEASLKWLRQK